MVEVVVVFAAQITIIVMLSAMTQLVATITVVVEVDTTGRNKKCHDIYRVFKKEGVKINNSFTFLVNCFLMNAIGFIQTTI